MYREARVWYADHISTSRDDTGMASTADNRWPLIWFDLSSRLIRAHQLTLHMNISHVDNTGVHAEA